MMNKNSELNRRDFLIKTSLAGAGLVFGNTLLANTNLKPITLSNKRKIGTLTVSPIGLGCMSMAGTYNHAMNKTDMAKLFEKAVESGVDFFDTAEVYGPFLSEEIVGDGLAPFKGKINIATKFGFDVSSRKRGGRNSKPENIKSAVEGSLKRLNVETIDLCYLHRLDPNVPIEDVAGTVKDLIQQGKIRNFGLSEVSPQTIRKAHAIQAVAALQTEYSLIERVAENKLLDTCSELGIAFVPWGPTCRGMLTGRFNENSTFEPYDRRSSVAYFAPDALKVNMQAVRLVEKWAKSKNITPVQFSLAWLLAQRDNILPIPGTTNINHLTENISAWNVQFTTKELTDFKTELSNIEVAGVRKPESVLIDQ
jgi:aryl-alcohol dehydrogenase-like predicted oxidoreductase